METLKTAFTTLLLLAVLYGAYVQLHKPSPAASHVPPSVIADPPEVFGTRERPYYPLDGPSLKDFPSLPPDRPTRLASSTSQGSVYKKPLNKPQGTGRRQEPVEGVLQSDTFEQAWQIALAQIANKHWYGALSILSRWYNNPDLSNQQQRQLLDLLDPIAGKVIYSADHLIEAPYEVRPGDSLVQIAHRLHVPANLLAKINGIDRPEELTPGVTLKIVPGPFRAEVDLNRDELTLFVGRLYAGRFQLVATGGPGLSPGEYRIADHAPRQAREPTDLQNGVGEIWLQRKDNTDRYRGSLADDTRLVCISLSPMDTNDVRDILSEGSVVLVRR